ncbi:MAG: FG-GAP-like repeat-containing protein, partial [Bacteroidota bacterium]
TDIFDFDQMSVIEFDEGPNFHYNYPLDYDEDGDIDLINFFYRYENTGALNFDKVRWPFGERPGDFFAWADFNNDGQIDDASIYEAVAGDFNNDGWLDILKGTSVALNDKQGGFSTGFRIEDRPAIYRSVSDLDGDGRLDILTLSRDEVKWFQNNVTNNNWFQVKLATTHSNLLALHARIFLWATVDGEPLTQMRHVRSISKRENTGYLHHFGLGDALAVDSIRVEWPSGLTSMHYDLRPNQVFTITEPEADIPPGGNIIMDAEVYSPTAITVGVVENSSVERGTVIEYATANSVFVPVDTLKVGSSKKLIEDLSPSTEYRFRSYSYNNAGVSEYSNVVTVTTYDPCTLSASIAVPELSYEVYKHELSVPKVQEHRYKWQLNGEDLNNGDQSNFIAEEAGVYRVIVQDQFNCIDTSNHVVIRELMPTRQMTIGLPDSSYVLQSIKTANMDRDPETELLVHVTDRPVIGANQGLVLDRMTDGTYKVGMRMPSREEIGLYYNSHAMDYNRDDLLDLNLRSAGVLINELDTLRPTSDELGDFREASWRVSHAGDFNNDGLTDLYMDKAQVGFRGPLEDELYLRQTDGSYAVSTVDTFNGNGALVDLDNDGTIEVWAHYKFYKFEDDQYVAFADGPGSHSHAKYYPVWADMDNDLQMDLSVFGRINYMNGKDLLDTEFLVNGISVSQPTIIADFDNNGWKDLLLANSFGQLSLIMQVEKGQFVHNQRVGILSDYKKRGQLADLDLDGDLDLITFQSNETLLAQVKVHDNHASEFYRGTNIQLKGTVSNPFGVGATVYVTTKRNGETFVQMDQMLNKENFSLHFGLADAEVIDKIEVHWPNGVVSDTLNIPASTPYIKLTEPQPSESFCDIGDLQFAFDSASFFCDRKARLVATGARFHHNFEWYKDGEKLEDASGQVLEINGSGSYHLKVSSNYCSKEVEARTIGFQPLESEEIVKHTELIVCEPDTVFFDVTPLDYPNLTYQWQKDGELLDANATAIKATESGIYELRVNYNAADTCVFLFYSFRVVVKEAFDVIITDDTYSLRASIFRDGVRINDGFYIYRWFSDGEQVYSNVENPLYSPDRSGT